MISAKVIADSIHCERMRITTFVLEYPRFIHSEFMTHRLLSRNASSSRAIPVAKMIERVRQDPAMPLHWGRNQAGMQAREELSEAGREVARARWLSARDRACDTVEDLVALGLHKQVANRLLEPWMHISVVCTATEWGNFFNLRYHADAQPEIQALSKAMWEALKASVPVKLGFGQWHLPFITADDLEWGRYPPKMTLQRLSAARCARVSYLTHEGKTPSNIEDLKLFDKLMGGNPKHASPCEHQARPMETFKDIDLGGNFRGWVQFRKTIKGEYLPNFGGPS